MDDRNQRSCFARNKHGKDISNKITLINMLGISQNRAVPPQLHQLFPPFTTELTEQSTPPLSRSHLACFSGRNSRVVARFSDVFSMNLRKERRPDLSV